MSQLLESTALFFREQEQRQQKASEIVQFEPRKTLWSQLKACVTRSVELGEIRRIIGHDLIQKNEVKPLILHQIHSSYVFSNWKMRFKR